MKLRFSGGLVTTNGLQLLLPFDVDGIDLQYSVILGNLNNLTATSVVAMVSTGNDPELILFQVGE